MRLGSSLTYVLSVFSIGDPKGHLDRPQENGITWVTSNWAVARDQPFTIEWQGHDRPVKVKLVRRAEDSWQPLWEIASGNTESSLVFRIPDYLSNILGDSDEYAFQISDDVGKSAISPRWTVEARQAAGSGSLIISDTQPRETATSSGSDDQDASSTGSNDDNATATSGGREQSDATQRPTSGDTSGSDNSGSSNSSRRSGLKLGARVGIGIGVSLGLIGLAFLLGLVWRKRRQTQSQEAAAITEPNSGLEVGKPPPQSPQGVQELYGNTQPIQQTQYPPELPAGTPQPGYALPPPQHGHFIAPIRELHHDPRPAELGQPEPRASELPTKEGR
ncbi:hypothetical protein FALBO_11132 [Fusarium albosuccineum]|uniref:Uncharacterized protein n=1 Tax=Fusarium albosuccineum TaxID=1237068 RepID=A0A8H4L4S0_9HYPO|nr:hypothetical protein FALBO_11132 [Fusarium albosuccineum]